MIFRRAMPKELKDAKGILEVHRKAVRGTAGPFYSAEIVGEWAPLPINDEMIKLGIDLPVKSLKSGREFLDRKRLDGDRLDKILLLIDCDFENEGMSGFDLIVNYRLQSQAILVTSRANDDDMCRSAAEKEVRILPKSEMHLEPIYR